jgi:hypothetical protein
MMESVCTTHSFIWICVEKQRDGITALMPIRKTKQGWFWGSRGPYKSKAAAQKVAKAAKSKGYKSK